MAYSKSILMKLKLKMLLAIVKKAVLKGSPMSMTTEVESLKHRNTLQQLILWTDGLQVGQLSRLTQQGEVTLTGMVCCPRLYHAAS